MNDVSTGSTSHRQMPVQNRRAGTHVGAAARAPLREAREHRPDALERPALRRRQAGQDEVLLDVEAAEDAAILVGPPTFPPRSAFRA